MCPLAAARTRREAYAWTIAQVKSILKDETYIENSVHYRETNISYKNKKRIRKDPSEWVRVEGTHEVIISKDVLTVCKNRSPHAAVI